MTTSKLVRRNGAGSRVRRALNRSLHALRKLYSEPEYGWERFFGSGLAPEDRTQAAAKRARRPGLARAGRSDGGTAAEHQAGPDCLSRGPSASS